MRAGKLRTAVKLQSPPTARTTIGQPTGSWSDVAIIWSDIRFQRGVEAIKADAPVSVASASVRIRWRADVRAAMRFTDFDGVVYAIKAVLPDARREYMDCVCEVLDV